ncbi:N-acylethanolamine amidohydrolase, putative [Talaromyces stipitatus ATCC 10500]|uniref:N-acylethanolamine amidohydrolase, putative n=1 Tax=Talaromyces stipitatus (strain ATCC 10500 / CBS 375.48 / QM 6759 / NRRL 1006) TaxID=441959 RepID=B8M2W6_TALSN|nr:N-acylethanolamine amidohydrolase, putative [Talaromyces stipitatus ATCC 10500]EED22221.1 N-acylethanolamine amidohydrolase, putative [Talaromyces stipitatus ATCC 10500]
MGATHFRHYPEVRKGPEKPYEKEDIALPVLRGPSLSISATVIHHLEFLQNHLWRSSGLTNFRKAENILNSYQPRFDPTVWPILSNESEQSSTSLPAPQEQRGSSLSGFWTSADYHQRYLSGDLTPTIVVETLLPMIQRDAKPPGRFSIGFLEAKIELVRAAAAASTKRYREGKPLGPLDGVPVAVKDEVHMKGYKRTLGSKSDFSHGFDVTSWCVEKWEEAGAIVIGKTTMHEIGIDTTNNNPNTGTPRNPYNRNYYCGGSSGGSGYALATGLVPIALGADGGGSIRIPSSYCGVYGLKPTHGRISAVPTPSLAPSVGVYGPMSSNIDDLALAYRLMAAPPPIEADSIASGFSNPLAEIQFNTNTRTIGVFQAWIDRSEPAVRNIFDQIIKHLKTQKGYNIIDIEIPYLPEGQQAHALTILAELAAGIPASDVTSLLPHTKVLITVSGSKSTGTDYIAAQKLRSLLMSHLSYLFTTHPGLLILTPTAPIAGCEIKGGEKDLSHGVMDTFTSTRSMEYVWLANFTGCPAISVPGGYDDSTGIPVGVMAMGEWGSEESLLEFARDTTDTGTLGVDGRLMTPVAERGREDPAWVDVIGEAERKMNGSNASKL